MQTAVYILFLVIAGTKGAVLPIQTAVETSHFAYYLQRDLFFSDSGLSGIDGAVQYVVSAKGRPDLPQWLHIVQNNATEGAVLYGSPDIASDATEIDIVATNEKTLEVVHHTVKIKVSQIAEPAEYFVHVPVTNLGLDEFLFADLTSGLLSRIQAAWPRGGNVYVHKVKATSPKKGVEVIIGGSRDFSAELQRVLHEQEKAGCLGDTDYQPEEISLHYRLLPPYIVDWCNFALERASLVSTTVAPVPVDLEGPDVSWKTKDLPRRDLYILFMVTIVLPCALALLLLLIIGYIMFGRREGLSRRDQKTPDDQLSQFQTIRRATASLRLLSDHRDSPLPLRLHDGNETYYLDTLPRKSLLPRNPPTNNSSPAPNNDATVATGNGQ